MQLSAAEPSVFFLMRMSRSPMRYLPRDSMLSMACLPNLADDEADHRSDDAARDGAGERRDLEIEQATSYDTAPHAGQHDAPRRGRPPQCAEHTATHREAVEQRL